MGLSPDVKWQRCEAEHSLTSRLYGRVLHYIIRNIVNFTFLSNLVCSVYPSNSGSMGSNPTRGTDICIVCVCVFCPCDGPVSRPRSLIRYLYRRFRHPENSRPWVTLVSRTVIHKDLSNLTSLKWEHILLVIQTSHCISIFLLHKYEYESAYTRWWCPKWMVTCVWFYINVLFANVNSFIVFMFTYCRYNQVCCLRPFMLVLVARMWTEIRNARLRQAIE